MRKRVVGPRIAAAVLAAALMLMGAQLAVAQQPPAEQPGTQPPGTPPEPPGAQPPGTAQPPATPPTLAPRSAQGADLSVSMRGEQDCEDVDERCKEHGVSVREDTNYRLTVHIRNDGPGTATNVRAQIRTPEEFEVERVSPDVCDHSRYCEIGTLQAGQDAVITLRGEYSEPQFKARNWVFVQSDALDPDHDNNEAGQRGEADEPRGEDGDGENFTCFGREPTFRGTNGEDEFFRANDEDDVIATFGGNDGVLSFGGEDRICLGAGDDGAFVEDGEPGDRVDCGAGFDVAIVDPGDLAINCEIVFGFGGGGPVITVNGSPSEGLSDAQEDKVRDFLDEHNDDLPREVRRRIEKHLD